MRTVSCTTPACPNENQPITVELDTTPVQCGPCGAWIIAPTLEPEQ